MTRQQAGQPLLVGECPQAVQGGQVVSQAAVPRDDRGTPAQHGVPREQGAVGWQEQADRVGGVPGGGDHPQLTARLGNHVPGRQAAAAGAAFHRAALTGAARQRWIRGQHRCPGQPGQPGRAGRVVLVAVSEQDAADPLTRRRGQVPDPSQVRLVVRPRVDHHRHGGARLGDQPGVSSVKRHGPGVRGEDAARPYGARAVDRRGGTGRGGAARRRAARGHSASRDARTIRPRPHQPLGRA